MPSSLLFLVPAAVLGGGFAVETALGRRDHRRFPPPGKRVDVGGHALHARVLGEGDPVIVLEAGAGEWSSHWDRLPERLSELSTVIAYDRAGLGWSDPGPGHRTAETQTRELRQLLRVLAPERPVLLVGHSVGAHVLRTYAHRYPFQVAGLVFVDGYHESLEEELAREGIPSPAATPSVLRAFQLASRFGILRAAGYTPLGPGSDDLPVPASTLAPIHALGRSPAVLAGMLAELSTARESDAQVASMKEQLDVPVRVLTAGATLSSAGTPKTYPREAFNRVWSVVNARLADVSSDSQQTVLEDADHLLPLRFPQSVFDAVQGVLEAARGASVG